MLLGSEGKYDQAVGYHERALDIRRKRFGGHHLAVTESLDNLAAAYKGVNRLTDAEKLLRESISLWSENMGADHPATAQAHFNLGSLLFSMNRFSECEQELRQAEKSMVAQYGRDHQSLSPVYNALSIVYDKLGHVPEARSYASRFVQIMKKEMEAQGADTKSKNNKK